MSGLNPFTRALLRIADWIAGENQSEWTAAVAAGTDAAGGQGLSWALGCVGAAFRMRLRTDWKWLLFAIGVPLLLFALSIPWFFAVSLTMRELGIRAPVPWAILITLPSMIALLLGARFARGGVPFLFILYSVLLFELVPILQFAVAFDKSPLIFFEADSEWLTLPRNQGMALLAALLTGSVIAGRLWRRASLRTA